MLNFIKNICINYRSIFSFGYLSTLWLLQKREGRQPELWSPHHFDEYDTYHIWFIAYLGILYIHLLIYFQNSNNLLAYHFRTLSFSVVIQRKYQHTFVFAGTADAKAIVPPSKQKRKPELWSSRHLDEYDTYYIWFIA